MLSAQPSGATAATRAVREETGGFHGGGVENSTHLGGLSFVPQESRAQKQTRGPQEVAGGHVPTGY